MKDDLEIVSEANEVTDQNRSMTSPIALQTPEMFQNSPGISLRHASQKASRETIGLNVRPTSAAQKESPRLVDEAVEHVLTFGKGKTTRFL